jgi:hypothetical protein
MQSKATSRANFTKRVLEVVIQLNPFARQEARYFLAERFES